VIGVEDDAGEGIASAPGEGGRTEGIGAELGAEVSSDGPAHHPPRAGIQHAGQVAEALVGGDVGDIPDVEAIDLGGLEAASHQVRGRRGAGFATRCHHLAASTDSLNTEEAHQASDPLVVHSHSLPPELGRHPWDPVASPGLGPDVMDPVGQVGLLQDGLAGAGGLNGRPLVVGRFGHLTYPAQGPDVEAGLLGVDEAVDPHPLDSSFTQKATARFKISRSFSSSAMRFLKRRFSSNSASS
jgi:hypothetical protein